jgi:hypothetical protein
MDLVTAIRVSVGILVVIAAILPMYKIFTRAGFSGFLVVLLFVPLVNLIVLYYVAFSKWNVRN